MLVNNAGVYDDVPLAGMSGAQWDRVIDVSLNGFYNVTHPLLLPMIRTRWGRIINVSSVAGVIGNRGQVNYAAAKAGLHGATMSLALELASAASPSMRSRRASSPRRSSEQAFPQETIEALVPMKRAGTTEEVAALVAFLASEQAGVHHRPGHFDQRRDGLKGRDGVTIVTVVTRKGRNGCESTHERLATVTQSR